MNILVTGSSGLVGSAVVAHLSAFGHRVIRLIRRPPKPGELAVQWDPVAGTIDAAGLDGLDAVVHLAGESIMGAWTPAKKAAIRDSRVRDTRVLSAALADTTRRPQTLICASATGYYGHRHDEILTEESASGVGFLAEVGRAWEQAAEPAVRAGLRVVHLRFGIVLSANGGALQKMAPPFRLGLGGRMGSGRQYWSWIALDDILGVIDHVLATETLRGPVNAVAPQPVTNREFAQALGRALLRPACLPMPAIAVRALFGELGDEAFLSSARVEPAKLVASGYPFHHPTLDATLRELLRPPTTAPQHAQPV